MVKTKSRLDFNKSIISTLKDNLSSQQVIDRLASLHEELSTLNQDSVETSLLERYRIDLINKKILKSKDPGIQAFAACCLSDILRLFAPDAPYTDKELTDIFRLFLGQLRLLEDPDNGYYIQQTYLTTSLLEYRSIVLLTDLPNSAALIEELFEIFYGPENSSIQERLFKIVGGLLGEVISECESLPMSVLKMVFNKFLSNKGNDTITGLQIRKDPGFEFSLTICNLYSNRLGRHFTKFYSEIMYEILNSKQENDEKRGKSGYGYRTLTKLNKLTSKLWEYAPDLVGSVTGFIYQLLCSDNELFRESATCCVSDMLTNSLTVNFVVVHNDTYKMWLSKVVDISPHVRYAWVKGLPNIFERRNDISDDLQKGLAKTLIDSDHLVRLGAIEVFEELRIEKLWSSITNAALYTSLLHLTRETRRDVREKCIDTVSKIYVESIKKIPKTLRNQEIWDVIGTIPSVIFDLYYINDPNINIKADTVIFEHFLPLNITSEDLVDRLIHVMESFDKKAFSSFYAFNKRQVQISTVITRFIEFCEQLNSTESENTDAIKSKFYKTIEWLSFGFPDQLNVADILMAFKELNDRRIYHLMKSAVADESNHTTLRNAVSELLRRLHETDLFRKKSVKIESRFTKDQFVFIFKILLYRGAPLIYNVSNISLLLDTRKSAKEKELSLKRQLIDNISSVKPSIFKDQIKSLTNAIKNLDGTEKDLKETLTIGEALRTIYKISKVLKDQLDTDDTFFFDKVQDFAIEGTPLEAKYAVKLLGLTPEAELRLSKIKAFILPLNLDSSKNFSSNVLAISEIFKIKPQLLDDDSTDIISYLIKNVLLANEVVGDPDEDASWITDKQINSGKFSPLSTKIFALKLLTNKLRSISKEVETDPIAKTFTEKTMKLFFYLIASGGELISEHNKENYPTPSSYQTKLRCFAGLQVLKLARLPSFGPFIKPSDISKLINLVEDECIEVRTAFIERLKDYVAGEFISIKFLPLIFFTAYEPDPELKANTKIWINFTFNKETFRRGTFFERALPRLIHSIAHHPDVADGLSGEENAFLNSLTTSVDYLIFFFDSVATASNLGLLYYLAGRVRQYRDTVRDVGSSDEQEDRGADATEEEHKIVPNVYIISELAQLVLNQFKEQHKWTLSVYPGKLNLPSDLFEPFDTINEARVNTFETYLSANHARVIQKSIEVKVNRMFRKSQTHKQQVQKRKLTDEYRVVHKKQRPSKSAEQSLEDSDEDDNYVPSNLSKMSDVTRKSSRRKNEVDYRDDESAEED